MLHVIIEHFPYDLRWYYAQICDVNHIQGVRQWTLQGLLSFFKELRNLQLQEYIGHSS